MAVFTDDFAGANGDDVESRSGWTRISGVAGAAEVNASNQARFNVVATDSPYKAPNNASTDHYAQCTLQYGSSGGKFFFPLAIRLQDADNFFGFRIRATSPYRQLFKRVGGTFTLLASDASDPTPRIYKLETNGGTITVYQNGTSTGLTSTDAALNTATDVGFVVRTDGNDPAIDDWESNAVTAGGINGTASITLAGDTVSAAGQVAIAGAASITLADDTVASSGAVGSGISGAAAITLANETVQSAGQVVIQGAANITLGADTVAGAGVVGALSPISGAASITLAADTVVAAGAVFGEAPVRVRVRLI